MITCTSCGHDVTGKKFCPDCGSPVQATQVEAATGTCPRCNGTIKAGTAFCMHCGSSLAATAVPVTVAPAPRQCPACHAEVSATSAFCTSCGQNTNATPVSAVSAAPSLAFCTNCGTHNNAGVRFCAGCGQAITPQTGAQQPYTQQPYTQPPSQYPPQQQQYGQPQYNTGYPPQQQQYGQPQYNTGYPPQQQQYGQPQYNTNYPPQQQQYGQPGGYMQPDPMMGQQPMVLRCPVCMAMAPMGTPACPSCHTSLAGVVPTSSAAQMQGQQQGGMGGMFQGNGGKYAMGALGGAAAVLGGEMLLHNLENRGDDYGYEGHHHREQGLLGGLGGLGELGNDIGLF